ncbi:MAG: serine hydrolase domain-containing protein [Erysipelotrichaceae bacterium]
MKQLNQGNINYFISQLEKKKLEIHNIVLLQNGQTLLSKGYYPYDPDDLNTIYSCTKSFISLAIGILYDKGLIRLDGKLLDYLPQYAYLKDYPSAEITIKELLTMQLGHDKQPYIPLGADWVEIILKKPLSWPNGDHFHYYNLSTYLLSVVIDTITQDTTFHFLKENILKPLNITECYFDQDNQNRNTGGWGMHLSCNDLAKFGQLLLNKGRYNGKQIVSENWIEMATQKQIDTIPFYNKSESVNGYGYQFWMSTHNSYRASGLFGQLCLVNPDNQLVLAITSAAGSSQPILDSLFDMIDNDRSCDYQSSFRLMEIAKGKENQTLINKINNRELVGQPNSAFEKVKFCFENDVCHLILTKDHQEYFFSSQKGKWKQFDSDYIKLSKLTWATNGTDLTEGYKPSTNYGCHGWVNDTCLQFHYRNSDLPARYSITVDFDCQYLTLTYAVTECESDFTFGKVIVEY